MIERLNIVKISIISKLFPSLNIKSNGMPICKNKQKKKHISHIKIYINSKLTTDLNV